MEARVNVNENDVVTVKLQRRSEHRHRRVSGAGHFRGNVYQIANTAVTSSANTQEEVTNFEVRIRVKHRGSVAAALA